MTNLLTAFLFAVAQVEQNPVSHYGLTKAAIADVNAHTGSRYTWEDRRDKRKAAAIAVAYVEIYHPRGKRFDVVVAARIIRYGPSGARMQAHEDYEDYGGRVRNLAYQYMGDA